MGNQSMNVRGAGHHLEAHRFAIQSLLVQAAGQVIGIMYMSTPTDDSYTIPS
jgi:hypothetical protein